MKKIVIIEDDRRIAQNIKRGLQEEGYAAEVVYEGINGRQIALNPGVDLVILDINLPGINGFEVCRSVRSAKPHLPIIMLSALGEIEDKVEGLGLGADDYVVKPFDFRELIARIETCLRRSAFIGGAGTEPKNTWQLANLSVNGLTKEVLRGETAIELTAREFALLEYMIRNRGRVLSKMDIAEHVWHLHHDPGTSIVEVYITCITKLWYDCRASDEAKCQIPSIGPQTHFDFKSYDEIVADSLIEQSNKFIYGQAILRQALQKALVIRYKIDPDQARRLILDVMERHLAETYHTGLF